MKQLTLFPTAIDPAEEAARSLIRKYVQRGDDPAWIRDGGMGSWTSTFRAQIGGYCDPFEEFGPNKRYSLDHIIVNRDVNGTEGVWVFNFWKVYEAVKAEVDSPPSS